MDKFFVLQPADGTTAGAQWATASPYELRTLGESQKCPVCGTPVTARRWLPPHQIKLSKAKPAKWADFMWGPDSSLFVSQPFKQIYEREGLTGISSFWDTVQIVRMGALKNGQFPHDPPAYHLVHVLWGGANQDDAASGLKFTDPSSVKCTYCRSSRSGRRQDRIVLEKGSWSKDIFLPRAAPPAYVVSERFKQVVEDNHFTNARFIPAENYAFDDSRWGKWYVNGMPEVADRAEDGNDAGPMVDDRTEQNNSAGLLTERAV